MNRNQKIAIGCGGAGCLGLIVLAVVGGVVFYFYSGRLSTTSNRDTNYNFNTNRSTNSNSATNRNSSTEPPTSTSSMSDDGKHKLFQAASMTGDAELVRRVTVKIGLMKQDYTPSDAYQEFVKEHIVWALSNSDFIQSVSTPDKARAYVNAHFDD